MAEPDPILLYALALMSERYIKNMVNLEELEHEGIPEKQLAVEVLAEYGLVIRETGGGTWTQTGRDLLDSGRGFRNEARSAGEKSSLTQAERRLLYPLALLSARYLYDHKNGWIDHMCSSENQLAVEVLAIYGLVKPEWRGGSWTKAGRELLGLTIEP